VAAAVFTVPAAHAVIEAAEDHAAAAPFSAASADFSPVVHNTIPVAFSVPMPRVAPEDLSPQSKLVSGVMREADVSESIQRFLAGTLPAGSQPADGRPHKIADMLTAPAAPAVAPAAASAPGTAQPAALVMPPVPAKGASALSAAMAAMGTPYRWGGTGRGGFDCSGLAQWAYRKAGITLPRSSRAQSGVGTPVSRADLQPGDLVFFYRPVSHVGIYVGNGNVVHAPQTGDVVKISPISRMPFAGARRL
jgi:cell wall-associated NlpC family hydrolase